MEAARAGAGPSHRRAAPSGLARAAGATLLRRYGCTSCHAVAGVLPNTPDALVRWIVDPRGVDSLTAMPDVGVTEAHARDIAVYLCTLR